MKPDSKLSDPVHSLNDGPGKLAVRHSVPIGSVFFVSHVALILAADRDAVMCLISQFGCQSRRCHVLDQSD